MWAICPTISPGVAIGDPGIPGSTEYRCAGGDTTLLRHQVTTYFPSHLFGHGNSNHMFPETAENGRKHTLHFPPMCCPSGSSISWPVQDDSARATWSFSSSRAQWKELLHVFKNVLFWPLYFLSNSSRAIYGFDEENYRLPTCWSSFIWKIKQKNWNKWSLTSFPAPSYKKVLGEDTMCGDSTHCWNPSGIMQTNQVNSVYALTPSSVL